MAVFDWPVQVNASGALTLRTRKSQFGDGYSQEVSDGLNNKLQTWSIAVIANDADAGDVAGFLDLHAGATSFQWTPPLGVEGWYRCRTYNVVAMGAGWNTVTAEFEQVAMP